MRRLSSHPVLTSLTAPLPQHEQEATPTNQHPPPSDVGASAADARPTLPVVACLHLVPSTLRKSEIYKALCRKLPGLPCRHVVLDDGVSMVLLCCRLRHKYSPCLDSTLCRQYLCLLISGRLSSELGRVPCANMAGTVQITGVVTSYSKAGACAVKTALVVALHTMAGMLCMLCKNENFELTRIFLTVFVPILSVMLRPDLCANI